MQNKFIVMLVGVLLVATGCVQRSYEDPVIGMRNMSASQVFIAVNVALDDLKEYKEACGGYYCDAQSPRAKELKTEAWIALGFVPVDPESGTYFSSLIREFEELTKDDKK